jgi:hypothetical protein
MSYRQSSQTHQKKRVDCYTITEDDTTAARQNKNVVFSYPDAPDLIGQLHNFKHSPSFNPITFPSTANERLKFMMQTSILVLFLGLSVQAENDPCGIPTEPCMNAENWSQCRSLVDQGCQNILYLESCPLQFACDDDGPSPNDGNEGTSTNTISKNEPFTLESNESCDTMVASHSFEGTCCSVTNTETGGCKLTVVNGMCSIVGPTWSVAATSTLSDACPEGDYGVVGDADEEDAGSKAAFALSAIIALVFGTIIV